jgi:hypothetical protein
LRALGRLLGFGPRAVEKHAFNETQDLTISVKTQTCSAQALVGTTRALSLRFIMVRFLAIILREEMPIVVIVVSHRGAEHLNIAIVNTVLANETSLSPQCLRELLMRLWASQNDLKLEQSSLARRCACVVGEPSVTSSCHDCCWPCCCQD